MKSVLTVCIGNICRSPMAEGLLAAGLPHLRVVSAGTGALIGQPADATAQKLMRARGIDISGHVAQQVSQLLCRQADLILVMDLAQRRHLESTYPFVRGKVFRIADTLAQDVPDPYRQGEAAFTDALALIEAGARSWIERVLKITKPEHQLT
ncbi:MULTISPECIES: low molecular weight protein-tyrosine-phosphatase [Variovorax]|uniref:protein-tyrosine-phosphatase n=1 Tax=Variovorax paradoxus (strain EPS) TaxID=595537 RepID=E6UVS6_VARPE|nr:MULTISPECIES: low molecular weight protein-tyrosine-phosphatase [Variovorax]ADU35309.1 protein tyrosine phosphatase [Variovorax paradoxus EPS]MDQ0042088.1 protein-tyrosine phosphatase [Variovorax boronicumulans]MDQ0069917.1 protein-tyrosine phosphatase [Variovorax boronicumulans]